MRSCRWLEKSHRAFDNARRGAAALPLIALAACATAGSRATSMSSSPPPAKIIATSGYRIVSPSARGDVTMAQMIDSLSRADVVIFGEQHDDPETHRAELEVLDAIGQIGRPVVLSLEMFERDVQPALNDYLAGRINESDFLAHTRPWPRYETDYRRLVELARARHWPVIASDVPRSLAAAVGRKGLAALDTLTAAERLTAARENVCPVDDYRTRFMDAMHAHATGSGGAAEPGDSLPTAMAERFYLAQCLKDETMAESIVKAKEAAPRDAIVVHFEGAFHSDYGQGTVDRVRRREPLWDVVVISALPVADPMVAPIAPESGVADFVIFTRQQQRSAEQP
jgi:uncharacterized iron-regulated protein